MKKEVGNCGKYSKSSYLCSGKVKYEKKYMHTKEYLNKISSLLLILLTSFAVMSCDKEEGKVDKPGVNNGKRLQKTVYYDADDNESSVEEWTYTNNLTCMIAYKDGTPVRKMELLKSGNASLEQIFTWSDGNWNMQSERIFKKDSEGRTLSVESRMGNPSYETGLQWYTYSGDSVIIVSSLNGEVTYKNVTVQKGNTTESIRYSYLGDYQWEEVDYRKTVVTLVNGDEGNPLSVVISDRNGNVMYRGDYEWNGENYKQYMTYNGVKSLNSERMVDGNTTTQISYMVSPLIGDSEKPIGKIVTKDLGNIKEEYSYGYIDGAWVLAQKKVDYYE